MWGLRSEESGVEGALEEQECDEQIPAYLGGGGLAKSETCRRSRLTFNSRTTRGIDGPPFSSPDFIRLVALAE